MVLYFQKHKILWNFEYLGSEKKPNQTYIAWINSTIPVKSPDAITQDFQTFYFHIRDPFRILEFNNVVTLIKVIIEKSHGEVSLMGQDTIENVS